MVAKMIDKMTLDELKDTYLCKKYDKDPIKCLDCEKHDSCPAGKRAIELLNEMTESNASKELTRQQKSGKTIREKVRKQAEDILKHNDPIKYLMETEGLTLRTARERIRKYKMRYPDLFTAEELKPKRQCISKKELDKELIRKADYEAAVASGDPIKFYKDKYGLKYDSAYHRWKYAEEKYTNNMEDKKDMVKINDNEEDISLDDFLSQHCGIEDPKETEMRIDEKLGASIYSVKDTYESLIQEKEALEAKLKWYDDTIKSFLIVMNVMEGR